MNVTYAKQPYILREEIKAEFDDLADMFFWSSRMKNKGYKVSEIQGMAVGKPYIATARRNRLRKTFEFEAIGVGKGNYKHRRKPRTAI